MSKLLDDTTIGFIDGLSHNKCDRFYEHLEKYINQNKMKFATSSLQSTRSIVRIKQKHKQALYTYAFYLLTIKGNDALLLELTNHCIEKAREKSKKEKKETQNMITEVVLAVQTGLEIIIEKKKYQHGLSPANKEDWLLFQKEQDSFTYLRLGALFLAELLERHSWSDMKKPTTINESCISEAIVSYMLYNALSELKKVLQAKCLSDKEKLNFLK